MAAKTGPPGSIFAADQSYHDSPSNPGMSRIELYDGGVLTVKGVNVYC